MGLAGITRNIARGGMRRLAAPLHERRHRFAVRRGRVGKEALRRARGTWWGDDPRWYPAGTPPRRHNRVLPLIDGQSYLGALYEALAQARHYVYIAGWCVTPELPLQRHNAPVMVQTRLQGQLAEAARRVPVRVLLWAGASFLFQPSRATMEDVRRALQATRDADLRCRLDTTAHFSHCHHQKAVVIDGQIAFVGGMDLTTLQGDRWDTTQHPLRAGVNWHDVQVQLEGEAVADVERNFRQRWQAVAGSPDLPPSQEPRHEPSWQTPVQIVRTIARHTYDFAPRGEFGIHHVYLRAFQQARRLIYLENQYLWSPSLTEALLAAMERNRSEPFRIAIVLPARAYDGKWDNDQHVQRLREADRGRGMVSVYCPYAGGPSAGRRPFAYRPIYVHAKVAVIDDEWAMVGSANMNSRGLITDSEIVAAMRDPELARSLRIDLWAEHLGMPREAVAGADPITLLDTEWPARAAENARIIRRADGPLIGALHRYEVGRMPGSWFLEEAEALTVEH